ncbi:MAG: hypothetical protein B7Y82_11690 [Sphingomonadales bacterium 32-65-25]|nr:MAG: hypothetical protein B7Y82_11690 [Sphingomonadales bacterium 32-65-25]
MDQRQGGILMFEKNMLQSNFVENPAPARAFGLKRAFLASSALSLILVSPAAAQNLPSGGVVASGGAVISQTGSAMNIVQSTNKAVVNWQSFDISAGSSVKFTLPDSASITLNRVVGDDPSKIFGSLTSNGQIFLLNPNGVLFGATSRINAAGIVASTLSLSDDDFNAGRYVFKKNGSDAAVTNEGEIVVTGYAALLASTVRNEGLISARMGTVALAGGDVLTLDLAGNSLVSVQVDAAVVDQLVENRGMIAAQDGRVIMTLSSERRLVDSAIASKLQQAQAIVDSGNGRTNRIVAGGQIEAASVKIEGGLTGRVEASGSVSVQNLSGLGGQIDITGGDLVIADTAKIDASGRSGGGAINIGGGFQGADAGLLNARTTVVAAGASISADALNAGDGGNVVVWSDKATRYAGNISARGGAAGGNGGFAEVSGKKFLDFTGSVNLRAPMGLAGTLLLDPYNLTISTSSSSNVTGTDATGDDSVLAVSALVAALDAGNVVVTTGTNGTQDGNITVANAISWLSENTLTLRAAKNIGINANILGLSGSLVLEAGYLPDGTAQSTGIINLASGKSIRMLSGSLTASAVQDIVFNGSVQSQAASSLTAGGGILAFNTANIFSAGVAVTSGASGGISLKATGNTELKAVSAGSGGVDIDIAGSITSTASFMSAGTVSITTTTGSDGNIDLTGAFSSSGLVTLSADKPGFIRINNITNDTTFSSISGGGAITLTSAANIITLGSTGQAITGVGGDAGQASGLVSISATAVNIATSIVTAGGNISITSTSGAVTASTGANITTTANANTGTTSGSVSISGASGVELNNIVTTGAANNQASGSNAATVNVTSSAGNVSVFAITTSGGQPQRVDAGGVGLDNGGNAASITLTTSGANRTILRGNLTAIGGNFSGTSTAAQGLGGNILTNGAVTLADHISLDTGATTGYVFLLGTVDSESSAAADRKALTINAGAGNVRLGGAIGQTNSIYSLDVSTAVTTDIFASIKTDGSTALSGRTTGIRIGTSTKLNFGNLTTESNNTPVVIDTSGGDGVFTLNNGVYSTITAEMHAPVVFTRGTNQVYLNSTLFSTVGEYNNLTFNTASGSGGAVTVISTIGGGTQGNTSGLGDISLSSVSNLSFQAGISAKSLVSLGGTGSITLATNGGTAQHYSGASGLQVSSSSGSALSVNMNATLTQSGAPVSVATTAAGVQLTISGTTTTAGGAVTISTKGLLQATQNNSSIFTSNGAITLTGLGGINNQSFSSTSSYNAGSGKIRMFGGGNNINQFALLTSTNADTDGTPAVLVTDAAAVNLFTVNSNANSRGVGTLQVGIVASDTSVAPAQSVGAGGSLALLATDLRLRTSQALKLAFTGDESANSFVITGTDVDGNAQSETVAGASAASVTTTKLYKTIASVVATNATAANVSVGLAVSDTISGALSQPNNPANQIGTIDIANLSASSASSISITSSSNKIDTLASFDVGNSLTVKAVGHTAGMALTGNVTATSIDIGTGNGALILGNFNITGTSGSVTLTGLGITQGASSTISASSQVNLFGYDYNNGYNRGVINLLGNIVAGDTSNSSVGIHGFTNVFLGNITAGTAASRGGFTMGQDGAYRVNNQGNNDHFKWFTGSISQNANTALKVGYLHIRSRDASAGSGTINLTNPNNEFRAVDRIVRYGSFSIFDADTEGNNLVLQSSLHEGSNQSAIKIKTMGALAVNGIDMQGWGVILEGSSITSSANIWSGVGDLILRPNGGNVTLSGTQRSNSSAQSYYIQNSNNVQLGFTENNFSRLQFGADSVTAAVSASQEVSDQGGALSINGTAAASSLASSVTGNRIIITSGADDSARTFTVTGTDMFGRALTETITGANAAAASGSKYFSTVTSVSAGTGNSSSVAVGWATESVAGNVTQQNDVDLTALSGKVGGSITLDRSANSFNSVTNLTAGGAISLRTDNVLTVSGALISTTGAMTLMSNSTQTVSSTGSVTADGNIAMTSTGSAISIAGAVTSNAGAITLQTNNSNGTISVTSAGSVRTLGTTQALTINGFRGITIDGALTTTGNISISTAYTTNATGAFSNTGAITSSGTSSSVVITTFQGQTLTVGGAISAAGSMQLLAGGTFSSTSAGVLSTGESGSVAIRSGYLFATANTYSVNLAGNLTAGSGGVQFYSNDKITQTAGVITSTGNLVGINANGGTPVFAAPSAQGNITLNQNNQVAGIGPFYIKGENGDSDFSLNNTGGGLRIAGDISTSNGSVTLKTAGGLLDLQSFNIKAGEFLVNGGGNITLSGRGINQSLGTINANGSISGSVAGDGTAGGKISLTGHDGTASGSITLNGTLSTLNNTTTAITIRGTSNLTLPSIVVPNGTLILGDDTATIGLITGNISQASATTVNAKAMTLGTDTNAIGGSVILTNSGNKFVSLGVSKVGDVAGTQYDLDIADSTAGLSFDGAVTSAGGVRITTTKTGTDASGVLAIGGNSVTAQGDIFLAGATVTQSSASTINAGSGAILVNGGGGSASNSITLSGTVITTSSSAAAIQIVDAANTTVNIVTAASGGVVLGTTAAPLSGTVSQTATTGLIRAATLTGSAGVLTANNVRIDNLGTLTTTGALSLKDIGGTGTAGLAVTGTVTAGAASTIETTDGALSIGGQTLNVAGFNLVLKGVGISQTAASAVYASTADINAGASTIDLASELNNFSGQVTLNSTGASVSIADINQLSLNSLTGKLASTTSISAIAGTNLVLTPEDLTTTTGNIYFQSKNGDLSTPGNLTTGAGSITLVANFGSATTGDTQVNNTITTTSGNVLITADREVNLAKSILSTSGNITVSGQTITHSTGSSTDILKLKTGSSGNIAVSATEPGGLTMGPFYYYESGTGSISVAAGGTIRLSNITSGGLLDISGVGLIEQYNGAAISVSQISVTARDNATAGSGSIMLANLANDAGTVKLVTRNNANTAAGVGAISYFDANAFSVAQIQSAGTVTLTSKGIISTAASSALGSGSVEANTLTVKTLDNAGAGVLLTATDNNVATVNISVRNLADTAGAGSTTGEDTSTGTTGTIRYTDSNGFAIASISTGASTVLTAGGSVTQSGAIQSTKLGLSGAGSFTLGLADTFSNPLNEVSVFASEATGSVVFTTRSALTIGTVNPVGIMSGGAAVSITAPSIDSTSATIDTRSTTAGTSGGAVTLTSTGTGEDGALLVGAIITSGQGAAASDSNGGNAGAITLTAGGSTLSVAGTITARGGAKTGSGVSGADGTVKLLAVSGAVSQANGSTEISAGQLIVDAANASALEDADNSATRVIARISGEGQGFTYRSTNAFSVDGGATAGLTWRGITTQGGAVTLGSAGAAITVSETITTRGGAFTAGAASSEIGSFNSTGVAVTTAGDITIGNSTLYSSGGVITIRTTGDITTGTLTSSGDAAAASASAGALSLQSLSGTISAGAISANGRDASGGNVSLTAARINLLGNISSTANTSEPTTSGGTITLTGATVLNGDRILTTGATSGGDILFLGAVDADGSAFNLTLTAGTGNVRFAGVVGGNSSLTAPGLISVASATDVTFAEAVTAGGFQQLAGSNLTLVSGAMSLANGFSFTGTKLTIDGAVSTGSGFTVANSGLFTTSADGDITSGSAFSQTGSGLNNLAGDISTSNSNISLAQAVTLMGDVSFASSGGSITFLSTVDGDGVTARAITLGSGSGNVTFSDKLGETFALGGIAVNSGGTTKFSTTVKAGSVSTDAAGSTEVFANIETTGNQFYRDVLTLKADVSLTAATVKAYGSVSGSSKTLSIIGNAELGDPDATGDTVTGLASLDVSGTTLIDTATLTSTGTQNFQGDVTLGTATTLTSTNSAISFGAALDSAANEANGLIVAAGNGAVTFTSSVGATSNGRLGVVRIGSDGITAFLADVRALSLETNVGGTTKLAGAVDTTGAQVYNDLLVLTGTVSLTGTDITLGQTVDSDSGTTARALTVSGSGTTILGGAVGTGAALASLTVNNGGTTLLNAGAITTTGDQTYSDTITLGAATVISATNVTFGQTVKSNGTARALTVTGSGTTTFDGTVGEGGAGAILASLTVNGTGTTLLNGGLIVTAGAQAFENAVTLGFDTVLTTTNSNVRFGSTLNSAEALAATPATLSITAGAGDVSFVGTVGDAAYSTTSTTGALGAVTLASAKNVSIGAAFTASSLVQNAGTGVTTIDGATSLTGALTFTGAGLTFNAAVTAGGAVTVANSGSFTTIAAGTISSVGAFSQSGTGANSLGGNVSVTGTGNAG